MYKFNKDKSDANYSNDELGGIHYQDYQDFGEQSRISKTRPVSSRKKPEFLI